MLMDIGWNSQKAPVQGDFKAPAVLAFIKETKDGTSLLLHLLELSAGMLLRLLGT